MTLRVLLLVFLGLCFLPIQGVCGIYGYEDEEGVYHFTNIRPANKKFQVIIAEREKEVPASLNITSNDTYDNLILRHSKTHGVDPALVKAVVRAESNFNPNAVSHKGAQGLMQLMPDTAKLMNVDNPFDPDNNIEGGTKYLRLLDDTFQGDMELILAAYNAGPTRVIKNNKNVPPIEETKSFIKRVRSYYEKLKNAHEG